MYGNNNIIIMASPRRIDLMFSNFIEAIKNSPENGGVHGIIFGDCRNMDQVYDIFGNTNEQGQNAMKLYPVNALTEFRKYISDTINKSQNEFVIHVKDAKCKQDNGAMVCDFSYVIKNSQVSPLTRKVIKNIFGDYIKNNKILNNTFTTKFDSQQLENFYKINPVSYYQDKQKFDANLSDLVSKTFSNVSNPKGNSIKINVNSQCEFSFTKKECTFTLETDTIDNLPIKTGIVDNVKNVGGFSVGLITGLGAATIASIFLSK